MEEKNLFDNYVAYEVLYETKMKKEHDENKIYPSNWYRIYDYQLKIDILIEALDNNLLISDTSKYKAIDFSCVS